jgi:hypothetical protein
MRQIIVRPLGHQRKPGHKRQTKVLHYLLGMRHLTSGRAPARDAARKGNAMRIVNAKTALAALHTARELETLGWRQWCAYLKNGASSNEHHAIANSDKAEAIYTDLVAYLERLA